MTQQKIAIDKIRIDGGTQSRVRINNDAVAEYAEVLRRGDSLPPVTVLFDGADYWLADGFHRYHGHKAAELSTIAASVINGDKRAAILYSVGANDTHGLRRTNDDKRNAVTTLLQDDEWSKWSDRKIAEQCKVSANFVGDMRKAICNPIIDRRVERAGVTYTQNVSKIGPKKKDSIVQLRPTEPESPIDGGPSEEEQAEAELEIRLNRESYERILASDDKAAALDAEVKRLNAQLKVEIGQKNRYMNEAAEWKRRAIRAEKKAGKAAA